jgi:PPP family 3-phenylpropionic acid transporter
MQKVLNLPNKLRLIYLFAYACAVCWVPVFALYYKKAGLAGVQIGILASIPPAIYFVVQPFWGFWADRIGRKKLLVIVMILSASVFLFFPQHGTFLHLFLLTLALGIFWSTVHPLVDCMTLDMVANSDERAFSFFRMWGSIGWSAGSLVMTYINLSDNLVFNFRLASVFLVLSLLIVLTIKPIKSGSETNVFDLKIGNIRELLRNIRLISFLVIALVIAILTAPIWYYTSIFYSDIGASSSLISLVYGLQGLIEIPFFFIAYYFIKRYGLYQMLVFSFYINALRSFLYAIVPSPQLAIGIELLQGISWALMWVCCVEYVNEVVPQHWRATGQSLLWSVFLGAGTIIGNIWTGFLYEHITIQKVFLFNSIGLLIFSILVTFYIVRYRVKDKVNFAKN